MIRAVLALALAAALGCSSRSGAPDASAPRPDAGAGARTCAEIRACATRCGADAACGERCTAGAPDAWTALAACSRAQCPRGDIECRCAAECYDPGPCLELVDTCTTGGEDPFCDEICH